MSFGSVRALSFGINGQNGNGKGIELIEMI